MPGAVPDAYGIGKSINGKFRTRRTGHLPGGISTANVEGFVENPDGDLAGDAVAGTLAGDDGEFQRFLEPIAAIGEKNIKRIAGVSQVAVAIGEAESNGQRIRNCGWGALRDGLLVQPDEKYLRFNRVVGAFDAGAGEQ